MRIFLKLATLFFALFHFNSAFADAPGVYCFDSTSGQWIAFGTAEPTMDRQVNIGNRQYPTSGLQAGSQRVFRMSDLFLQCRNSYEDNSNYTMRILTIYRPNSLYTPGLINNGYISYAWSYNSEFSPSNFEVISLPPRNTLRTLTILPSLVVYATGTAVPTGGSLGRFKYALYRNGVATGRSLVINLIASSTTVFQPETCDVNDGLSIDVDLGTMSPRDIPVASGALQNNANSRQVNLRIKCENNSNATLGIQLVAQPADFSQSVVEAKQGNVAGAGTVIPGLGIEFYHEGIPLKPNLQKGGFTTPIVNGVGNTNITVSPVKSPDVYDLDIPAGYFNATATLILLQP